MRAATILLVVVALVVGTGYWFTVVDPVTNHLKQGLDLQGGIQLVLRGVDSEVGPATPETVARARDVIERRINRLGVSEPLIQMDGRNRIIVALPDVHDTAEAERIIGKTAVLTFVDPEENIVIDGRDIDRATAIIDPATNKPSVQLKLKGEGADKFAEATTRWVGNFIQIRLDEDVISAPIVNQPIYGGTAIITGNFDPKEAQTLADLINGGALPVKLEIIENRTVSATLGKDSLQKSLYAGVVGLLGVLLFMLVKYQIPGFLANIALIVYLYLVVSVLVTINAVLTLPGLAGLLLSIGMAVDGNILIFERIKEELRAGKGIRSGIEAGFHRAFITVLDANVTTILAGAVLWYLGTGPVKGFALTLVVGNLLAMFTAITLTRWLLKLTVGTGWFGRGLFGVKEVA
jgi:preprotein translocase subunit SecD